MSTTEPINLDSASFDEVISTAGGPVLVDFWAAWCPPCRALAPTIDALAREHDGSATIAKVDVDQAKEIARRYGIQSIPTVLVFSGGEVVARHVGIQRKDVYARSLDEASRAPAGS